MIAEIIPNAYDFLGKKVSKPTGKRVRTFHPTFPMGRYLSQSLSKNFNNMDELRRFLLTCRYVSDEEQFGKMDYWLPPEEFEKGKKGDCEDFALYAWRQLMAMGMKSRFVVGEAGKYGEGHAWVTIRLDGRCFLFEPLACGYRKMPRLWTIRYKPEVSVEYHGGKISYFSHKKSNYQPSFSEAFALFVESIPFYAKRAMFFVLRIIRVPIDIVKLIVSLFKHLRGSPE